MNINSQSFRIVKQPLPFVFLAIFLLPLLGEAVSYVDRYGINGLIDQVLKGAIGSR